MLTVKDHTKGDVYCSCAACPHGNALQCADYECMCCVGSTGKPYTIHYLKNVCPPATNF